MKRGRRSRRSGEHETYEDAQSLGGGSVGMSEFESCTAASGRTVERCARFLSRFHLNNVALESLSTPHKYPTHPHLLRSSSLFLHSWGIAALSDDRYK